MESQKEKSLLEQLREELKTEQEHHQLDGMISGGSSPFLSGALNRYEPSAREHYQSFLLQAAQVGTNVEKYIIEEIDRLKRELER